MANVDEFLGSTLQEWTQNMRNGFTRAFLYFALHETGVLESLRGGGKKTCAELAEECNIDGYLLDGALNFLLFSDKMLERDADGRYSLTDVAEEWLFADTFTTFCWGAVGSYSIVLQNLVPALHGRKQYGKDFIRDGDYLAIGSHLTGRGSYGWVSDKFTELGVKRLVDLGCGTAGVLSEFVKMDPNLHGVGVDIVQEGLDEARRRVDEIGIGDRVTLVHGDITKPETYADALGEVDAFNAMMVVHEFLRDGEDFMVKILADMKAAFPGAYMITTEFHPPTPEEFLEMPIEDRIHFLYYQYIIHPFTLQGIPVRDENWFRMFEKAGVSVVDHKPGQNFSKEAKVGTQFSSRLSHYVIQF